MLSGDPLPDFLPFLVGHAGLVAERHRPVLHRLRQDERRVFAQVRRRLQRDVLGRLLEALVRRLRGAMQPGDRFLLGADLRKDVAVLEAAYNDSRGVTAEVNRNMLSVLNRTYVAPYNSTWC